MRIPFFKQIACYLVFTMAFISAVSGLDASMVDSELINISQRQVDMQKLQRFLESEVVTGRLKALGYQPEEIKQRLNSLSDEELHQFAMSVDQVRVAGDSGLGVIVTLLVIAILVVLLLQLTGHRIIVVDQ